MAGLSFWHIDPITNDGQPVADVVQDKPIYLYLGGANDVLYNLSKKNLNQALRSFIAGAGIASGSYELYVPTLASPKTPGGNPLQTFKDTDAHAKETADFLMPAIPPTQEALKLFFSRITVLGYSRGCQESCGLVAAFKKKLKACGNFTDSQIDDGMRCMGIVNIVKGRKYNLPEYVPVPTYTVTATGDTIAYPYQYLRDPAEHSSTGNWHWQTHAKTTHALQDNHLVVEDGTGVSRLRAVKLEPLKADAQKFASRLNRHDPDWAMEDTGKSDSDAHHLYLYTNTDARFIPDKATQVFQSMASAPVTVGILQKLVKASVEATIDKPRDAAAILQRVEETDLSEKGKELLKSKLADSNRNYDIVRGRG